MSALPVAAARICSRPSTLRAVRRPLFRCLAAPAIPQRVQQASRNYVSPSKKRNAAQVNLDTEIRLDKEHFMSKTGVQPGDVRVPSGVDPDAVLSSTAGTSPSSSIFLEKVLTYGNRHLKTCHST